MEKVKPKREILKTILSTINCTGSFLASNTIPYTMRAVNIFDKKEKRKYEYYIKNKIIELRKRGLIKLVNKNGVSYYQLSEKGEKILLKYKIKKINKRKTWDGKWRIIIFDVPEKFRNSRDKLRQELKKQDFFKLQDSVWATRYDCEEFVALLKTDLKIGKNLIYIEANYLDFDKNLKNFFNL